jgi:type II secretory pathway component PulJ
MDARQIELDDRRKRLEEEFERKKRDEEVLHNQLEKLKAQYLEKEKQLVLRHEENKLRLDRLIAQNQSEALKLRQSLEEELRQREQALEARYHGLEDEWTKRQQEKSGKERQALQAQWDAKYRLLLTEREEIERRLVAQNESEASSLRQKLEEELRRREQVLEARYQGLQEDWTRQQQEQWEKERQALQAQWDAEHKAPPAERSLESWFPYKERCARLEAERKALEDELTILKASQTSAPIPPQESNIPPVAPDPEAIESPPQDEYE